jgi:hypothetical protein
VGAQRNALRREDYERERARREPREAARRAALKGTLKRKRPNTYSSSSSS